MCVCVCVCVCLYVLNNPTSPLFFLKSISLYFLWVLCWIFFVCLFILAENVHGIFITHGITLFPYFY